jgi:hypothetical protein
MKKIVSIATKGDRPEQLKKAIESLQGQVDEIYVYDNTVRDDLTDNGKFYYLNELTDPCYYFTCDDDLLYPTDYIENMTENIDKYNCIVTHHGRKLIGTGKKYYVGHIGFGCLRTVDADYEIDVAGTGVTGFRTDYFNPKVCAFSTYKKMSDVVFSLEAAKQNKTIMCLWHLEGWIKQQPVDNCIFEQSKHNDLIQSKLADEIYLLKNKSLLQ